MKETKIAYRVAELSTEKIDNSLTIIELIQCSLHSRIDFYLTQKGIQNSLITHSTTYLSLKLYITIVDEIKIPCNVNKAVNMYSQSGECLSVIAVQTNYGNHDREQSLHMGGECFGCMVGNIIVV